MSSPELKCQQNENDLEDVEDELCHLNFKCSRKVDELLQKLDILGWTFAAF